MQSSACAALMDKFPGRTIFLCKVSTFFKKKMLGTLHSYFFAGSRRVLATAVDNWLENLLALAPVQAYAHVQ